jgi:hypothetical protein
VINVKSVPARVGNTLPSATVIVVAEFVTFAAKVVAALLLNLTAIVLPHF